MKQKPSNLQEKGKFELRQILSSKILKINSKKLKICACLSRRTPIYDRILSKYHSQILLQKNLESQNQNQNLEIRTFSAGNRPIWTPPRTNSALHSSLILEYQGKISKLVPG